MRVTGWYSYDWFSTVPGMDRAFRFSDAVAQQERWLSSPQIWSAFIQGVLECQDVAIGQCARRVPIRALVASLKIMLSARDLEDAILKMRTFNRLADLPISVHLQVEDGTAFLVLGLEGADPQIMADLEVLFLTFMMTILGWITGGTLPFTAAYSRSGSFQTAHAVHPDFGCEVRASDWTGVCLPAAWINLTRSKNVVEGTVSDAMNWLLFGNSGEPMADSSVVRVKY